jgi:hypothetical protein
MLRLVERLESKEETAWSPELVFDLAADELFLELKFILGFGDPQDDDYATRFTDYFRLGPHGLQPFIEFLYRLYNATANWPGLSESDLTRFVAIIDSFATPIQAGILHLRTSMPRLSYDPPGFAELQDVLNKFRHKVGVRPLQIFSILSVLITILGGRVL